MPQLNPDTSWWAGYSSLQRFEEQWPAYTRRTNSVTYCIDRSVCFSQRAYIIHCIKNLNPDFCLFVFWGFFVFSFFPLSNWPLNSHSLTASWIIVTALVTVNTTCVKFLKTRKQKKKKTWELSNKRLSKSQTSQDYCFSEGCSSAQPYCVALLWASACLQRSKLGAQLVW